MVRIRSRTLALLLATLMVFMYPGVAVAADNLVVNGDFEAGNTGFYSDYDYVSAEGWSTLQPPSVYAIGTDPYLYHSAWGPGFGDHTSGDGLMMIVNGTTTVPPGIVWGQEVTLPECAPVSEFPLYAGQTMLVGDVLVKSVDGKICVKFVLNDDAIAAGWLISETHVAIADDVSGIPQKNGNPIPGQFPAGETLAPGVTETGWYCLDIGEGWTAPYAVAAHAVVQREDCVVNAVAPYGPDEFVDVLQGLRYDYTPVRTERSNPLAAFDFEAAAAESSFYSLGFAEDRAEYLPKEDGYLVVRFDIPAVNGDGPDLQIIEDTWGLPYPEEKCEVYAKAAAEDGWTYLGIANNQTPYDTIHTVSEFDLGALASASFVKLQDISVRSDFASKYPAQAATLDGYDVNAILALHTNRTCTTYSETAWGGTSDFEGKNWATYIEYTPEVCSGDYLLEFYAASSYPAAPAQLQVTINDVVVPPTLMLTSTLGEWVKYSATWDAGDATSAVIEITDLRVTYDGDDFVIDDISFTHVE